MSNVFQINLAGHLARALRAFPKNVAYLGDFLDAPAAQHLDEDLVSERAQLAAGEHVSPQHEVAAHRVAHPAQYRGENQQSDELGAARENAAEWTPVADPSAGD